MAVNKDSRASSSTGVLRRFIPHPWHRPHQRAYITPKARACLWIQTGQRATSWLAASRCEAAAHP
jgi:hypothetical protein